MTEFEANITDGFRNEDFVGEVTDFLVKEINGSSTVTFQFVDGPDLSIFHSMDVIEGDIPGYTNCGILIRSLTALKCFQPELKVFIDVDDNTFALDGIRTEPDICGMTLSFLMKESTYIKDGEEKINKEWRVVDAVRSDSSLSPKPQSQESTPPPKVENTVDKLDQPDTTESVDSTESIDVWNTIVLDVLSEGEATEAQIMKAMKDATPDKLEQAKLNKVRRDALLRFTEDGVIIKDGSKFKLVT